MGFYDRVVNSFKNVTNIKKRMKNDPATSESVSSALAAELTLISTILVVFLLFRHIDAFLTVIIVLITCLFLIINMPIIPKLKREQNDSLERMTFYVILTLGILLIVIYWGTSNV